MPPLRVQLLNIVYGAPFHGKSARCVPLSRPRPVVLALAASLATASATVFFEDRFATGMDKWVSSDWKTGDMGKWEWGAGEWFGDEAEAKGIITTDDLKHHAISAKMDSSASTTVRNLARQGSLSEPSVCSKASLVLRHPTTPGSPGSPLAHLSARTPNRAASLWWYSSR